MVGGGWWLNRRAVNMERFVSERVVVEELSCAFITCRAFLVCCVDGGSIMCVS